MIALFPAPPAVVSKALALQGPANACVQSDNCGNCFFLYVLTSPLLSEPVLSTLLLPCAAWMFGLSRPAPALLKMPEVEPDVPFALVLLGGCCLPGTLVLLPPRGCRLLAWLWVIMERKEGVWLVAQHANFSTVPAAIFPFPSGCCW